MKQSMLFIASFLLLTACTTNSTDEPTETDAEATEVEERIPVEYEGEEESAQDPVIETNQTVSHSHLFKDFVNEKTFVDSYALEAWDDYQEVVADAEYGDITFVQSENPDLSQLEGSSFSEMETLFEGLELREDVYREEVAINETETLYFYRYPAEAESGFSEVSDFLAELTFYFIEENLVFSAITPGFFQVELNNLPDVNQLTSFTALADILSINPQVFTMAELKINQQMVHQLMTPALFINEEGTEELMAFYFFTHGEEIIQYAYLPFQMVSQSFPDNSIILYQQIIPEIATMNLDEAI